MPTSNHQMATIQLAFLVISNQLQQAQHHSTCLFGYFQLVTTRATPFNLPFWGISPSFTANKFYLPHFCIQFPSLFGGGKYIYKPPHFEPIWSSGLQVLPLLSTPIPLLGTEEAQQCRKKSSQLLFLYWVVSFLFLFLLCYIPFASSFLLYCPSTPSMRDFSLPYYCSTSFWSEFLQLFPKPHPKP